MCAIHIYLLEYSRAQMDVAPPEELPVLFCSAESLKENERTGVLASWIASEDINIAMRSVLVDWLTGTWKMLGLKPESFFAGVNVLDAVLARDYSIDKNSLQLCGATCLWIASKYHEMYALEASDIVLLGASSYTVQQVVETEQRIFKILGCNINVPQEMGYLRSMSQASGSSRKTHNMSKYLLFALAPKGSRFLPSVVITAIRDLMSTIYKEAHADHFGVPREVIHVCAREIILVCRSMKSSRLKAYDTVVSINDEIEWQRVFGRVSTMYIESGDPRVETRYTKAGFYKPSLSIAFLSPALVPDDSLTVIGEGTYGVVKRVDYQGKSYAVKQSRDFSNIIGDEAGILSTFSREVSIMQSLSHENIAKVRHITEDLRCIFLDLGVSDLDVWIEKNGPSGNAMQVEIAFQMFSALAYMHDMGCLHRDIKPKNIIVFLGSNNTPQLQLSDFGAGRGCQIAIRGEMFTHEVCTLPYRSPELLLGDPKYDDGLDCWSMLCTMYECATGEILFWGDWTEVDMLMRIFSMLGTPDEVTWPGVTSLPEWSTFPGFKRKPNTFGSVAGLSDCYKDLLQRGLYLDPALRPRAQELLEIARKYA